MKNIYATVLLCLCFFTAVNVFAQSKEHPWAATVSLSHNQYDGDFGSEILKFQSDSDFGLWFALDRYLNRSFDLQVNYNWTRIDYKHEDDRDAGERDPSLGRSYFSSSVHSFGAMLKYKLANGYILPANIPVKPYAIAGSGVDFVVQKGDQNVTMTPLSVGAGVDFKLSDYADLNYQIFYNWYFGSNKDNIEGTLASNNINGQFDGAEQDEVLIHTIGIKFNFPRKKDTDKDGIYDPEDECPTVPGLKEFNGCPDSDGDGVPDKVDDCPTVPGLVELNGCPDTDADGIADKDDACPTVAGVPALNGCPDLDGDGVTDAEDACPNVPGPIATNGCPDRDQDGIMDSDDKCPDTPGLAKFDGCPDTDGDNIIDSEDACPLEAGIPLFAGCPNYVYYLPFDVAQIPASVFSDLDDMIEYLQANPEAQLLVEGHADEIGTDAYNMRLSKRRAFNAVQYLLGKGISRDRIEYTGYGSEKPVDPSGTDEARAKNRRVVISIK